MRRLIGGIAYLFEDATAGRDVAGENWLFPS